MSRHDGVSCDSCMKTNFRGRRYKCLVCYDYDLCASCFEASAFSSSHHADHAMQCILTQAEFDVFYGGEVINGYPLQSITCPICGTTGFTEASLSTHVSNAHSNMTQEVVCPLCATLPNGDPNFVTDDYPRHLLRVHSSSGSATARSLASVVGGTLEDTLESRPSIPRTRRSNNTVASSNGGSGLHSSGRAILRRRNGGVLNLSSGATVVTSSANNSSNSNGGGGGQSSVPVSTSASVPSSASIAASRAGAADTIDPIAELLSQLSGVRRVAAGSSAGGGVTAAASSHTLNTTASQLQQLQWQLQLERQHVQAARDQLSRIPRRPVPNSASFGASTAAVAAASSGTATVVTGSGSQSANINSQGDVFMHDLSTDPRYILRKLDEEDVVGELTMSDMNEKTAFLEDLLCSTLLLPSDELIASSSSEEALTDFQFNQLNFERETESRRNGDENGA